MKQKLMAELSEFLAFVSSLRDLQDEVWFAPIGEGKWSIHDIVTHLMRWDEYFNTVTYSGLLSRENSELKEHPDYLAYNEQSVLYGKGKSKREIIEETERNRRLLIDNLSKLEERAFAKVYPGEKGFTLASYLEAFFTSHDKHHMKQMQDFIFSQRDC